jgi:predicted MPP superfamily phosphohydrolase
VKILFVGANALDTARLRIGEEVKKIRAEIDLAQAKNAIDIFEAHAVTPDQLMRLVLDHEPDIVHFSGHGSRLYVDADTGPRMTRQLNEELDSDLASEMTAKSFLFFETAAGNSVAVSAIALAELFGIVKTTRCVVLNACFSFEDARKIAEHVDCVIGMKRAIDDRSAIAFAVGFYQGIARGKVVQYAFDLGRTAIFTHNLPDADVPELYAHRVNPAHLCLVPFRGPTTIPPRPTSHPVAIAEQQITLHDEDEAHRLERAISQRERQELLPESYRRYTQPELVDVPERRFTKDELYEFRSLLARYFPQDARELLPDYNGFDFGKFARDYRARVSERHQDHRLLGLPPTQLRREDLQARISLSKLFVPLRFRADKDGAQPTSLATICAARKNVVVLGDPGMGKSTLLGFLALLFSAGAHLQGFVPWLPCIVPMLVPLRDFVQAQKRAPELRFIDYLALRASTDLQLSHSHWSFFDATLRMGEAVVLFDGLDEVGGDAARLDLTRKIDAFQHEYPHVPIWVTSRVYGYRKIVALPTDRFETFRILDLGDDQVNDFLERWYMLQYPERPRERDELRESLRRAVFRTPRVRRLAGCPLLLTLMAFIHRVVQSLPQDRATLYDTCVDMLLTSWQEARIGPAGEIEAHPFKKLNLHVVTQKDYLAHLALYIQEKNEGADSDEARGIIDRVDALECLAKRHYDVAGRSRTHLRLDEAREEMSQFVDYIADRSGLLLDRGGDKLSFIHFSFQEYLAAWLFTLDPATHDNPSFFRQHLGKQPWEEVLLLRLYVILRMQGGGGERAFDAVTSAVFRELSRGDNVDGWLTLVRALRDNLDFTVAQQEQILNAAISKWLLSPHLSGTWFAALEEVQLFSEKVAPILRSRLASYQAQASGPDAIACLHLESTLFGLTAEAASRFRQRADLSALIPELIAFMVKPGFASLLSENASADDWVLALSALNGPQAYGMTLGWVTGALSCPVQGDACFIGATRWLRQKIAEETTSRRAFVQEQSGASTLFRNIGTLECGEPSSLVTTPFSGVSFPSRSPQTFVVLNQELFCAGSAAECVAASISGREPLENAIAARVEIWIHAWLDHATSANPKRVFDVPNKLARAFGQAFGRVFGNDFVAEFGHEFLRKFATRFEEVFTQDFTRDFVAYFGRSAIRYFLRSAGRACVADFANTHGRDFIRYFVIGTTRSGLSDHGHDFGRHFGSRLGVNFEASNARIAFESALENNDLVRALLDDDQFWDWIYFSVLTKVVLVPERSHGLSFVMPTNPFTIALVLTNLHITAAMQQIFCFGRHFIGASATNDNFSNETLTGWLSRHPLDVHPTAWSWNEHAKMLEKNHRLLQGPGGALAMAHAEYASIMTGFRLDEYSPTWKNLVRNRNRDVDTYLVDPEPPRERGGQRSTGAPDSAGPITYRWSQPSGPPPVFTWLHVSDLHIGHPSTKRRSALPLLLHSLSDDVRRHNELGIACIDAIFVTGDIAWNGKREHYADAREYILELADLANINPDRIFTVPGNHDVDRDTDKVRSIKRMLITYRDGLDTTGTIDDELADGASRALLVQRQAAYLDFAYGFVSVNSEKTALPESRLYWRRHLQAHDGRRIRVIGLNTALVAGDKHDRGKLQLGMTPFKETLHDVKEDELVVLLSHHPFCGRWLADEREVEREARLRTHLHLSGHVHDAESEDHRRGGGAGMLRITAGAISSGSDMAPDFGYNFTSIIPEADGDGYRARIHPRRWTHTNREFRPDSEFLGRDNRISWVEHEIPRIGRKRRRA